MTLSGDDVRPTTDRVKEALFSIIQFEIEGRRVLDLFAGSGQLGIEALSRGAQSAVFVDNSKKSLEIVKANLISTGLSEKARLINADSLSYLKTANETFDIAFIDPPYNAGLMPQAIENTVRIMSKGAVIICEAPSNQPMLEAAGDFAAYKTYRYGKTALTVYRQATLHQR